MVWDNRIFMILQAQGTYDLEDLDGNIIVKGSAGSVGQWK